MHIYIYIMYVCVCVFYIHLSDVIIYARLLCGYSVYTEEVEFILWTPLASWILDVLPYQS